MIEAQDIIYDYPAKRALHGVSFIVRPGEVTALVGPNGAGKSTLLRCLAALDRPFSGKALIDGIDGEGDPRGVHERIGYLPDFFGLYDNLSVSQHLFYAARARHVRAGAAHQAVTATAARVGISDLLDRRAQDMSRGQRQRLAIGQAIVHGPRALLLDEPAAGLDPDARRDLSGLITGLAGEGLAIIVSSHILAELEDYSSAMLILREGRLVQEALLPKAHAGLRYRVALLAPDPQLAALLARVPGLQVESVAGENVFVLIEGGQAGAASVLKALISADLNVTHFAPAPHSMEDRYRAAQHQEIAR
jgi:ABC-2 type transport system ATP-binding protein